MQKPIALVLLALILGVAAYFTFWGGGTAPVLSPVDHSQTGEQSGEVASEAVEVGARSDTGPVVMQRTEVAGGELALLEDPEIRAGLSGFRGRVVTHERVPVADCGVRFYRGGMDSILRQEVDVFAEGPSLVPDYIAGETQTREDGTFLLSGIWPHGAYIMFAGIGTDAPMHELITNTPSPGEIVDLGDVVLPNAGIITGVVVDGDGEPLAGALVRCADVPGTLASFFPIERFEPDGALLVREKRAPMTVVEMPPWVKVAWEHVPLPTTYSGVDGSFRLIGVVPGSNMLAVTAKNMLSEVKPSVRVRAGEVKDVGRVRLREGEELYGKVVDTAGKPVVDAEVYAGSTINLAPVDLARQVEKTNAKGVFTGLGFAPGNVTVAARRGPGHAWVLAEPQPILSDVTVTLPATFGVDVSITVEGGQPAKQPRLRLLRGRAGDGAAEMAVFGFVPPVDLKERLEHDEKENRWRITNLNAGQYTLVADAPGYAKGFSAFTVEAEDVTVAVQLEPKKSFVVRVFTVEDKPIRNAAIYAQATGDRLSGMPSKCGRTDADGMLVIDDFRSDELRVSAEHPKYGVVNGQAKLGEELLLRMQLPGSLQGVVTENGAPPEVGKYTVIVEFRRNGGPRGAFEQVPRFVTPSADGNFRIAALQPGQYRLQAIEALSSLNSPGGFVQMMMSQMMFSGNRERVTVDIVSGQTAQAVIETGEKPIEGPTARLFGSIVVNGRVGEGYQIIARIESRRYMATADRAGRFDLGTVPAGNAYLSASAGDSLFSMGGRSNVWSGRVELKESEEKEVVIEVDTSSISGMVFDSSGAPMGGVMISAEGKTKGDGRQVNMTTAADIEGRFKIEDAAVGQYKLEARDGERSMRGRLDGIELLAGAPVTGLRLEMTAAIVVKGKVDLSVFGNGDVRWAWLSVHELKADGGLGSQAAGISVDRSTGAFRTADLSTGTYAVRLHGALRAAEGGNTTYRCEDLVVPPQGLEGVVLHGRPE